MFSLLKTICDYEEAIYIKIKEKAYIFRPQSNEELKKAVNIWCKNRKIAIETYGFINEWDTSKITDTSWLFKCDCSRITKYIIDDKPYYECKCLKRNFNDDINDWDVSNVINMAGTFFDCKLFNQPLNKWNTSKVKNMRCMFDFCRYFNQPLDSWDVSNVEDFSDMFDGCRRFVQPLKSWNLKDRSKNILYMFCDCPPIPRDI